MVTTGASRRSANLASSAPARLAPPPARINGFSAASASLAASAIAALSGAGGSNVGRKHRQFAGGLGHHIGRYLDMHRTGPRGRKKREGARQNFGQLGRPFDPVREQRDLLHHAALVRQFVQIAEPLAERAGGVDAGYDQHRHGIGARLAHGGDRVGQAGTGDDEGHARASRNAGVAVGHEARALLVTRRDVAYLRAREAAIELDRMDAGNAEHGVDAVRLEQRDQRLADGFLVAHCRSTGRVRQVGPPSQAMHSASASKVSTVQPAASMAALVFGKPATAMTWRGAVGSTLRLRPWEAWNSSASPSTSSDAARLQHLVERGRQKRRIDQRQIVGQRADHRHQMKAGLLAVPERQVVAVNLDAERRQQICDLLDAVLVRAHAAADGERLRVDPDAVATFDGSGVFDPAEDRHAHAPVGGLVQRRFGSTQRLSHGKDDSAMVGHQRRIMGKYRIGQSILDVVEPFDRSAGRSDEIGQRLVLFRRAFSIEARSVMPGFPVGAVHGAAGAAHQHPLQRRRHRLRSEHLSGLQVQIVLPVCQRHGATKHFARPPGKGHGRRVDGGKPPGPSCHRDASL